jgi:hypothetical protein
MPTAMNMELLQMAAKEFKGTKRWRLEHPAMNE